MRHCKAGRQPTVASPSIAPPETHSGLRVIHATMQASDPTELARKDLRGTHLDA